MKNNFDTILNTDSQKYVDIYANIVLHDENVRNEFIKLDKQNIAHIIKKGQEFADLYGIDVNNTSLLDNLKKAKEQIKQLEQQQNNHVGSKEQKRPNLHNQGNNKITDKEESLYFLNLR